MTLDDERIYHGAVPRRDRAIQFGQRLMWLPGMRSFGRKIVASRLKGDVATVMMEAGFRCLYGNISVGTSAYLCDAHCLDYAEIEFDDYSAVAFGCRFITSTHDFRDWSTIRARPIRLCRNAWVATGAIVLGGVTIGENSVIGAGSVVTKSIPDNIFAAGNPARPINSITRSCRGDQ